MYRRFLRTLPETTKSWHCKYFEVCCITYVGIIISLIFVFGGITTGTVLFNSILSVFTLSSLFLGWCVGKREGDEECQLH